MEPIELSLEQIETIINIWTNPNTEVVTTAKPSLTPTIPISPSPISITYPSFLEPKTIEVGLTAQVPRTIPITSVIPPISPVPISPRFSGSIPLINTIDIGSLSPIKSSMSARSPSAINLPIVLPMSTGGIGNTNEQIVLPMTPISTPRPPIILTPSITTIPNIIVQQVFTFLAGTELLPWSNVILTEQFYKLINLISQTQEIPGLKAYRTPLSVEYNNKIMHYLQLYDLYQTLLLLFTVIHYTTNLYKNININQSATHILEFKNYLLDNYYNKYPVDKQLLEADGSFYEETINLINRVLTNARLD